MIFLIVKSLISVKFCNDEPNIFAVAARRFASESISEMSGYEMDGLPCLIDSLIDIPKSLNEVIAFLTITMSGCPLGVHASTSWKWESRKINRLQAAYLENHRVLRDALHHADKIRFDVLSTSSGLSVLQIYFQKKFSRRTFRKMRKELFFFKVSKSEWTEL